MSLTPADELARRMRGPQRHRLLHGYPLAAALPEATVPAFEARHEVAFDRGNRVWNRAFVYRTPDQKVLWLTRRLAALEIDRTRYRALFGTDVLADFGAEVGAARDAGLLEVTDLAIRPTPRGMFYADSIAAVLASPAIRARRDRGPAVAGRDAPKELLHDSAENANAFAHL